MALQLLRDVIAVAPLAEAGKIGSIHVPDTAKQRTDQGIVMYRGPLCHEVRIGDHVFFNSYTGTKVVLGDYGSLIFMAESDVAFIDTSEPADMLIPRQRLLELLTRCAGQLKQRHAGFMHGTIDEVTEHLRDLINNQVVEGLEF